MKLFVLFKKLSMVAAALFLTAHPLLASAFHPDYDHRLAVGRIHTPASSGTATLVEGEYLVSAAHIFEELLPPASQLNKKSGPHVIDLKNRGVVWQYRQETNRHPIDISVLSMVVDAAYVHSDRPGDIMLSEAEKHDIVFLKLDPSRMPANLPMIPLINHIDQLPQMCAGFGYRHRFVNRLEVQRHIYESDGLHLNNEINIPQGDGRSAEAEIRHLLHDPHIDLQEVLTTDYSKSDGLYLKAIPGDSGGPLFITTNEGLRIIGIVSNGNDSLNGFASIMTGSRQNGYRLSPRVADLLSALKAQYFTPIPRPDAADHPRHERAVSFSDPLDEYKTIADLAKISTKGSTRDWVEGFLYMSMKWRTFPRHPNEQHKNFDIEKHYCLLSKAQDEAVDAVMAGRMTLAQARKHCVYWK